MDLDADGEVSNELKSIGNMRRNTCTMCIEHYYMMGKKKRQKEKTLINKLINKIHK